MKGVVHLDQDEDWNEDFLRRVIIHEFGHIFGLGHSSDNTSIMFPWYSSKVNKLNNDDKNGIEMLYGLKNKWAYNPYGRGTYPPRATVPTVKHHPTLRSTPTYVNISKPIPLHAQFRIVNSSINNLYVFLSPEGKLFNKTVSLYNLTNFNPN